MTPNYPIAVRVTADNRRAKRLWTEEEVDTLIRLSGIVNIQRIAEQLNRSISSVQLKAFWLNLPLRRR